MKILTKIIDVVILFLLGVFIAFLFSDMVKNTSETNIEKIEIHPSDLR